MPLHGKSLIAGQLAPNSPSTFLPVSPLTGLPSETAFHEARSEDIDQALRAAAEAFPLYQATPPEVRAQCLEAIGQALLSLGDALLEVAHRETGLPIDRLTGERGRTVTQLNLFAQLLREGSWCDARIDPALPQRKPLPRPDLRRMLVPLGPVIVFGASNFPLAFSVAGGDTASALAAGCPVVVKGHPAHPATCELAAHAIAQAVAACSLPAGIFSLIQGATPQTGLDLVRHPAAQAVGFTGSHRAGRALFDAASARPQPIPVFAEMSSLNPLVLLPGALRERGPLLAEGLRNSVTLGVGQFCTKPGLILATEGPELRAFLPLLGEAFGNATPATMLHQGICSAYHQGLAHWQSLPGVSILAASRVQPDPSSSQAEAVLFCTDASTFRTTPSLHEELFGPQALLVIAKDSEELLQMVHLLEGQLTATIHGTPDELAQARPLLLALQSKAGRLVANGFPTGVEVSPAMQHGGPYPATTDARFTSVGTAAIQRWARPLCFQNFPPEALPEELQDANPRGLMRLVDHQLTRLPIRSASAP